MNRLALFILLIVSSVSYTQQSITGILFDQKEQPVENARVYLLNLDSTVVSGAYSDDKGQFVIDITTDSSSFFLKITHPIYQSFYTEELQLDQVNNLSIPPIHLSMDQLIEEVTVKGDLDVLKGGIDKKIYSVANDISVRGGTTNDILNNIPSIDVDQDGNISLRGDGNVTILIDGRPSTLALGNGQNLLDALPANSIDRIEVVTNPSAKYDPDGTSGVINIVLKKNKQNGLNGIVGLTAATGNLYEANLGVSYRTKRFNSFLNYSFNYYEGFRDYSSDLIQHFADDSLSRLIQNREGTDLKMGQTISVGTDFFIDSLHTIGVSITGNIGQRERTGELYNQRLSTLSEIEDDWLRSSFDPRKNKNADVNLNYTYTFKKDKGSWNTNVNQSIGENDVQGFYEEQYFDPTSGLEIAPRLNQQLFNTTQNRIFTGQSDLEFILKEHNARVETGAKGIVRNHNLSTFSEQLDPSTLQYVEDTLANFDFNYTENIYSVYGIFGQELGAFSYQGGIRGEYALQNPELVGDPNSYKKEYLNLFPSAHLKYRPTKAVLLSLGYSQRINRPSYRQLNPFTSYANPVNLRRGNPDLNPEYINSFDAGFSYTKKKIIFSSSIFHRRTQDVIYRIKEFNPDNTSVVTYRNIDRSYSTGTELVLVYKPFKWFRNTLSTNVNYIQFDVIDTTLNWNNNGVNLGAKYALSIDFWKESATFQLNARYNAPRVTPQGRVRPRTGIDLSAEKRMLNKKLSVGLRITDVFNTKGFEIDLVQDNTEQVAEYKWLTRRIYVTASYRFGKKDKRLRVIRTSGGGAD